VDRAKWLWTHEARRRLARLAPAARAELAIEWGVPAGIAGFVAWMKTLDSGTRKRVEQRIQEATPDFTPTAAEREEHDLADWKALRKLDPAIVSIGSHTLTHPILPGVPEPELETEVRDSRHQLERGLERPVDTFAYPNGGPRSRRRGLRAPALPRRACARAAAGSSEGSMCIACRASRRRAVC
jgi:peptidoglycan/xylan/chitin deacetylase (PgdA/CDA1 family)